MSSHVCLNRKKHTQVPLYNSNYADQYQVSWINKRDEKINNPKHA